MDLDFDYIIIGSGFGGSGSALRLSEKGYKVLVLEKGKWWKPEDFPKSNWNLRRFLWAPKLGCRGIFKISIFRHVTIYSGVGVGGGSLVYANTLPVPKQDFFTAPSWGHLADWQQELKPYYDMALKMLGAAPNPVFHTGDHALKAVADDLGIGDRFDTVNVAVFFGKPNVTVPDPYFGGKGPERTGCNHCGACMLGCPNNSKNTLDKNYLYLAQQLGAEIRAESEVREVLPIGRQDGSDGYKVVYKPRGGRKVAVTARGVVFAGGVMGTMPLLLDLKVKGKLPKLSDKLGFGIRTNSESLLGATTFNKKTDLSKGLAITSILNTDEKSHLEVVRYRKGSGLFRPAMAPAVTGRNFLHRWWNMMKDYVTDPIGNLKGYFIDDWSKRTQILLFMQTEDSTIRFVHSSVGNMSSKLDTGLAPMPFIPEAHDLANRFAEKVEGKAFAAITETLFGIPSTAHILGGACMGDSPETGVIDKNHHVFGYKNMMVCDGSAMSANPGVNPSLSITALTERAMALIPPRDQRADWR